MAQEINQIECPECGHNFSVTEAMAGEIQKDVEQKFEKRHKLLESQLKAKEDTLSKEREKLDQEKKQVEESVKKLLGKERASIEKQLKEDLAKEMLVQLEDLKSQVQ